MKTIGVIYNAFPYFPEPARDCTPCEMGQAGRQVLRCPRYELAQLFAPWFGVDVIISNDEMYQLAEKSRIFFQNNPHQGLFLSKNQLFLKM